MHLMMEEMVETNHNQSNKHKEKEHPTGGHQSRLGSNTPHKACKSTARVTCSQRGANRPEGCGTDLYSPSMPNPKGYGVYRMAS